jgi:hypothetical protein
MQPGPLKERWLVADIADFSPKVAETTDNLK